jgi:hypothetical protein
VQLQLTTDRERVCQVGLLSKDNTEQIPFAYHLYASEREDLKLVEGFKKTFCRQVPIDFVGVWWVFGLFWTMFR